MFFIGNIFSYPYPLLQAYSLQHWGPKLVAYGDFQYIINNVVFCNDLHFFDITFIMVDEISLRVQKSKNNDKFTKTDHFFLFLKEKL